MAAALLLLASGCSSNRELPNDLPPSPSGPNLPKGDYALDFNGTTDYATSGTAGFPIASGSQSISLWARFASTAGTQVMIGLRTDFESGVILGIARGTVAAWNVSTGRMLAAASPAPTANVWHHLSYVFDGTTHVLYVDGVASGQSTAWPGNRTPILCYLGSLDETSQFYEGRIDDVRIWNTVRTEEQVQEDLTGAAPKQDAALVAFWTFNEVIGARAQDDSGRGNLVSLGEGDPASMPAIVPSTVPR